MDDIWAYRVSRQGDTSVIALSGEVDMTAEDELAEVLLAELRRAAVTPVPVDLDEVDFLDSSAINVLVQVHNEAREAGRHLYLVRAHRTPLKVLEMTGLLPLLAAPEQPGDRAEQSGTVPSGPGTAARAAGGGPGTASAA